MYDFQRAFISSCVACETSRTSTTLKGLDLREWSSCSIQNVYFYFIILHKEMLIDLLLG